MKITKSELKQRCIDNETAIATLEALLKEHGITRKQEPKLKQLDQSVFDGLDEKWQWAAVDGSKGFPVVYEYEPYILESERYYTNRDGLFKDLDSMKGYDTTDWQNSLIERDKVELTGSDLCRAMLERGDSRVVCLVSDVSDDEARDKREITSLIEGFSIRSGFYTERSNDWVYAVPANPATNEPLTASEVGL
jgi:hypothetical protein